MQKRSYSRLFETVVFIAATLSLACSEVTNILCTGEPRSETEIIELGNKQLEKFSSTQKIDKDIFLNSPPRLKFIEKEKIWVVDYQGKELFVRFIVGNCGQIETSYGPGEKVIKIE